MVHGTIFGAVACFVVNLSDDLRRTREKSCGWVGGGSREQTSLLGELDGLSTATSAELIKDAARMGLDGVLADEKALGDFAVAEAGGNQAEDFEFAGSDTEIGETLRVGSEGGGGGGGRGESTGLAAGEGETEPDAESREDGGDEATVNFEGRRDDAGWPMIAWLAMIPEKRRGGEWVSAGIWRRFGRGGRGPFF